MTEETATIPTTDMDILAQRYKTARLEAILFADFGSIGRDGKATLAGIFERLYVDPKRRTTGKFFIYVKVAEAVEAPVEITITDPDGHLVATGTGGASEVQDVANKPLPRGLTLLVPFVLELSAEAKAGLYWFEVLYKGRSLGGTALVIEFREEKD